MKMPSVYSQLVASVPVMFRKEQATVVITPIAGYGFVFSTGQAFKSKILGYQK